MLKQGFFVIHKSTKIKPIKFYRKKLRTMHKKFKNKNAETLYRLIVSLHMKQSKVAIQIGVSPATLTNYLKQKNDPSFETEYKVKQYLNREDVHEMIEMFVR